MAPLILLMAASSMAACTLISDDELRLSGHVVRIGDVVELSCIAETQRDGVAALELWRAPANEPEISFSRRALANLARRRAPALSAFEADRPNDSIRMRFAAHDHGTGANHAATPAASPHPIAFGDDLVLETATGPVRIERTVTAMQSSDGHGQIFVKDADGRVFSWSAAALRPAGATP